jgi:hypothetical protein
MAEPAALGTDAPRSGAQLGGDAGSDATPSALPVVDGLVPESDVDFRGEMEQFPAGSIRTGTFRLEAGRYLLICNIPQHYQQGMVAEFVVR